MAVFSRVKTWVSNEVLTAADLNAEFNNIINNMNPAGIEDASGSVALMQASTDPGGVGTESQATDLLGEIKRLRFKIKEIIGGAQWYSTPAIDLSTTINTASIADDAITADKIADNAVGNAAMADNAIDTAELADGAVETAKIEDLNVTTGKLADGAVTPAKRSTALYAQATVTSVSSSASHAISFTGTGRPVVVGLMQLMGNSDTAIWNMSNAGDYVQIYKNGSAVVRVVDDGNSDNSAVFFGYQYIDTAGYSGTLTYDLRSSSSNCSPNTTTYFFAFEL